MSLSRNSNTPSSAIYALPECHVPRGLPACRWSLKISGGLPQVKAQASLRTPKTRLSSAVACCRLSLAKLASPVPHMHRTVLKRSLMTSAVSRCLFRRPLIGSLSQKERPRWDEPFDLCIDCKRLYNGFLLGVFYRRGFPPRWSPADHRANRRTVGFLARALLGAATAQHDVKPIRPLCNRTGERSHPWH
jgi:hypothetical protein